MSDGSELGAVDRQAERRCVNELEGSWVQQQIGDSAWSVGDRQGRLQGVVA